MSFDTPIALCGPLRQPRQMLAEQEYGGHASIHDDAMAEKLGFRAGPIEGPTHFSQFVPLLEHGWLALTIPDKPNSRLQRYRLTPEGRALLESTQP